MKLRALANLNNLQLAWRRLTTGSNQQYKRFFRELYLTYELSVDENLRDLRDRLLAGDFAASSPERVYVPKSSGLHRPMTLLGLEDQIVYQAFANLAATKMYPKRNPLQFRVVFSHILTEPKSIFFFHKWQVTYAAFQTKVRAHFESGLRWVADFDLAAFYDTISHRLLFKTLYPRVAEDDDSNWLLNCLATWTSPAKAGNHGHGLPQGPIASDFLAECFLLPIDTGMTPEGYVRYVDDIRLLARTENEVRERVISLERKCRERGLIPQSGKFSIRRALTVRDALGMLPSIADPHGSAIDKGELLGSRRAQQLFRKSLKGKPLRIGEKTYARYVLFRAPPSAPLLNRVLKLVEHQPEFADAFFAFLSRCGPKNSILALCERLVRSNPYSYLRGEAWQVLADGMRSGAIGASKAVPLIDLAIEKAKERKGDFYERLGACHFLCASETVTGRAHSRFLMYQPALAQAFLAGALPDSALATRDVPERYFRRTTPEPGLAIALRLQTAKRPFAAFGIPENTLVPQVLRTLRALGLAIPGTLARTDPMAALLNARFGVPLGKSWRDVLGTEYLYALGLLKTAEAAFKQNPSAWLQNQNSFNQVLFLGLQGHLRSINSAAAVRVVNQNGEMLDFGVTLDHQNSFSKGYPKIAGCFREVNARRNRLPQSHPYEKKTHSRTALLKAQERNRFVALLKTALSEVFRAFP